MTADANVLKSRHNINR